MAWFSDDERRLLARVLEAEPDLNRKKLPSLRPLSLYSSELKNLKQVSNALANGIAGQPLSGTPTTAQRYGNTLQTHGFHEGLTGAAYNLNEAGKKFVQLAATDDGSSDFWQRNGRLAEQISFDNQIARLIAGETVLVNGAWRSVFFNVQTLVDHIDPQLLAAALAEPDAFQLEAIQYMNSVGTEPWRYSRLPLDQRTQVQNLMLSIRGKLGSPIDVTDPLEVAAEKYGSAINAVQRDIRFRVRGFVGAFLSAKSRMGVDFPRVSADGQFSIPGRAHGGSAVAIEVGGASGDQQQPSALELPRQVIISGCPGSGKSHLAESWIPSGTLSFRTQFHAETTFTSFVGSYRPVPVYEAGTAVAELDGAAFAPGRPLIDYRFVPGPATRAIATALSDQSMNFILLIEELNRANAAAVFGDFLQLLDRQEDGWSRYGIDPQPELAAYLEKLGALSAGERLRLPPNLYIWATMNSGDQGVFPIDSAFRRRWAYRYLGYSEACEYQLDDRQIRYAGQTYDWEDVRSALNRKLKQLRINEDRLIGPYFFTKEQLADPEEVLDKLLLYLWDDVLRFRQQDLFKDSSFAEVSSTWAGGEGDPFHETLVDPTRALPSQHADDGNDDGDGPDADPDNDADGGYVPTEEGVAGGDEGHAAADPGGSAA